MDSINYLNQEVYGKVINQFFKNNSLFIEAVDVYENILLLKI
ncbi:MAG: hypothetical protein ACLRPW_04745 [Intestinibacter sp.]